MIYVVVYLSQCQILMGTIIQQYFKISTDMPHSSHLKSFFRIDFSIGFIKICMMITFKKIFFLKTFITYLIKLSLLCACMKSFHREVYSKIFCHITPNSNEFCMNKYKNALQVKTFQEIPCSIIHKQNASLLGVLDIARSVSF